MSPPRTPPIQNNDCDGRNRKVSHLRLAPKGCWPASQSSSSPMCQFLRAGRSLETVILFDLRNSFAACVNHNPPTGSASSTARSVMFRYKPTSTYRCIFERLRILQSPGSTVLSDGRHRTDHAATCISCSGYSTPLERSALCPRPVAPACTLQASVPASLSV